MAGNPAKRSKEGQTELVQVRVSPDVLSRLEAKVAQSGLISTAAYLRMIILKDLGLAE